jgi:hypothetical protein
MSKKSGTRYNILCKVLGLHYADASFVIDAL